MKKILLTILMAFTIFSGTSYATETDFVAPTIYKPELLPGPSEKQVEEAQEKGGSRRLLTESILPKFAIFFIGLVGSIALLFLVIGGLRYTMIYNNEEAAEKAKNQIIWSIVGFLIAILSYAIVTIIINFNFR